MKHKAIHWFRQDLRIFDNPALSEAAKTNSLLTIYIFEEDRPAGSASLFWLKKSLESLNQSLNQKLCIYKEDPINTLKKLIKAYDIKTVYWNRAYQTGEVKKEKKIKKELDKLNIKVKIYESYLLWIPHQIKTKEESIYKIFSPFYKKALLHIPRKPIKKKPKLNLFYDSLYSKSIGDIKALETKKWHKKIPHWDIGEKGAKKRLANFLKTKISSYQKDRNFPAKNTVSRLAPSLHFGEISASQIWYKVKKSNQNRDRDCFLSELAWREFSYYQFYYNPDLPYKNLKAQWNTFPWKKNKTQLKAWQKGQTGIPIIDAGMRELWQTGYMHGRIRMICASFLVKNLLIFWQEGEKWFRDCLLDADLAVNAFNWQWVAGCGLDAAPYFRIFNPTSQSKKFDPQGSYIHQFVPELKKLSPPFLFNPWQAPKAELNQAGINLGQTYPKPIVDLKKSRSLALQAYRSLKKRG